MFFVTYLRRELARRMRQAIVIALGLAVGVGLVVTVSAVSAGVARAETTVLGALYGAGTDVTVTGAAAVSPHEPGTVLASGAAGPQSLQLGPDGPEACTNGKCVNEAGKTVNALGTTYSGISASKVATAARLPGVAAAAGGIVLLDSTVTFAKTGFGSQPGGYTVDGVDISRASLGPLGAASLVSGHWFTAAEADSGVAIVDAGYARSHGLAVGSALAVAANQARYTVVGIVSQPQGSNPASVYVPLARAQAMTLMNGQLSDAVNTIYLSAASAADVAEVSKEVSGLVPGATVTTASSLAGQVTGSLASAASLSDDLGRWLSMLVLAIAFAVACLLTMAAVSRRARDFAILKALGWRSRRIVAQVLGESAAIGLIGAVAGVGLGLAGAAIIAAVSPTVSATAGPISLARPLVRPHGSVEMLVGGGSLLHEVPVPLHPSVSAGLVALAVLLALSGGLLAGAFASWRIAALRPADALARVA
jgi:putative ABC transport system permease protein